MTKDHYLQLLDLEAAGHFGKLVGFIRTLKCLGNVPLSHIDTNDWQCNTKPSVYIHNKAVMWKTRRYSRCSNADVVKAMNFYNKGQK